MKLFAFALLLVTASCSRPTSDDYIDGRLATLTVEETNSVQYVKQYDREYKRIAKTKCFVYQNSGTLAIPGQVTALATPTATASLPEWSAPTCSEAIAKALSAVGF